MTRARPGRGTTPPSTSIRTTKLAKWSEKFGVSRDQLRSAVAKAGPMVKNVAGAPAASGLTLRGRPASSLLFAGYLARALRVGTGLFSVNASTAGELRRSYQQRHV
jgi:hypothetical protein